MSFSLALQGIGKGLGDSVGLAERSLQLLAQSGGFSSLCVRASCLLRQTAAAWRSGCPIRTRSATQAEALARHSLARRGAALGRGAASDQPDKRQE